MSKLIRSPKRPPPRDKDPEMATLNELLRHLTAALERLDQETRPSLASQIAAREIGAALRKLQARREAILTARG